jgi:hypothetical protein
VGDEAWDTFQVSCNEFRSTICKVCTGKNQFGTLMTCRGTHQGMPWAGHGTHQGMPWAAHGQAMAHTKAFFEAILGVWTRNFAHMLRKIIPSSLPSFTFFEKKYFFF